MYVDAVSGCRDDCGSTWSSALRNLQEAIDRAAERSFCEVWVADGTYYPTSGTDRTASFRLREQVAVYGGFEGGERTRRARDIPSQPTTLSGDIGVEGDATDNSFHVLRGADHSILHGFRIAYGQADGPAAQGHASGGGMVNHDASPVIDSCEFAFNFAMEGGAMLNTAGSPKVINSRFVNNNAMIRGGAMLNDGASPEIIDSILELGAAQDGGALYNFNSAAPRISRSVLRHNAARSYGGAIWNQRSPLQIEDSTFEKNYATGGGGAMYTDSCEWPYVSGSIFAANTTDGQGGALYNVASGMRVTNSVFVSNVAQRAGAIGNYGTTLLLVNATLAANVAQVDGGGLSNTHRDRAGGSVTNSILWGNVPEQLSSSGEVLEVTYSTVQGGCVATGSDSACTTDGTGNSAADPRFELLPLAGNPEASYDLRLVSDSPCIDAARTAAAPATDLEGRVRVREADMGAYEHPN